MLLIYLVIYWYINIYLCCIYHLQFNCLWIVFFSFFGTFSLNPVELKSIQQY